jgi:hypothetical protein
MSFAASPRFPSSDRPNDACLRDVLILSCVVTWLAPQQKTFLEHSQSTFAKSNLAGSCRQPQSRRFSHMGTRSASRGLSICSENYLAKRVHDRIICGLIRLVGLDIALVNDLVKSAKQLTKNS